MPLPSPPRDISRLQNISTADYLTTLRNTRPARPSGGRPLPTKQPAPSKSNAQQDSPTVPEAGPTHALPALTTVAAPSHRRANSALPSFPSSTTSRHSVGRPLVPEPQSRNTSSNTTYSIRGRKVSPTAAIGPPPPGVVYRESGERWLERQEALSLRDALHEMDLREHAQPDEDQRLYESAKDEASELVWQHQNLGQLETEKNAGYRNPDLESSIKNRFKGHLQKGAHARSQSLAYEEVRQSMPRSISDRSMSNGSDKGRRSLDVAMDPPRLEPKKHRATSPLGVGGPKERSRSHSPKKVSFTFPGPEIAIPTGKRKSGGQRNVSGNSTKGIFRNPTDQIYEEPVDLEKEIKLLDATKARMDALRPAARNALPRGSRPLPDRLGTTPSEWAKPKDRFEVHSPVYTFNHQASPFVNPVAAGEENAPAENGIEIRGDDLRAATSMRMRDRSPKLPTPTAVSDRAGRPIVSFDPGWKPTGEMGREEERAPSPDSRDSSGRLPCPPFASTPAMMVSAPAVPTISFHDDAPPVPTISLPVDDPATPSISVSIPSVPIIGITGTTSPPIARPLPAPGSRPTARPRTQWHVPSASQLSRAGVPTASCSACNLPISGRIVTADRTAMFHPECFTCFHCSTPLECVAFYPEPDGARAERLENEQQSQGFADEGLRFFCHLDFHEAFSPRCKNCKTPVEGHVVVACGSTWHEGHFFCAECGDV